MAVRLRVALIYLIRFQRLWPGHDFCQGQMSHKPRKRELSIFFAAYYRDKIHIYVKFH